MPVKPLQPRQPTPDQVALRERLSQEWRAPTKDAEQPVILEERDAQGRLGRVYVVWDDWGGISGVDRSEIILDACEERYGREGSRDVLVAMGLTRAEADRMRISY